MNLKEQLAAKKAELLALKSQIEAGDIEAITKADEITTAIEELENSIKAANRAKEILSTMGTNEGEESNDSTENEKSGMKSLFKQAKRLDKNVKGWNLSANFKAATDTITSVQIADVDREVTPQPRVTKVSDLLGNANISGNAVTYFIEDEFEGTAPTTVAEGAKKPQGSTGFIPKTEPLVKIAGFVKETDEVLDDNDFLASAVEDVLVYRLSKAENAYVVNKIKDTSGIGAIEYQAGDNLNINTKTQNQVEAILKAKTEIDADTAYTADTVFMNPADFYNMIIAKDANGQYFGGGWNNGAYGNGGYVGTYTPWGLNVFVDGNVTEGEPIVAAAKEAIKFYRKNDATVRVFEQNEDDALYNRVTVLAEERILTVVKAPAAVYKLTAVNE